MFIILKIGHHCLGLAGNRSKMLGHLEIVEVIHAGSGGFLLLGNRL